MFIVLIIVHVVVSLILIALVLLQPGEGKGLSETFGGGVAESILGSKANSFLIKATAVMAAIFFVICITLTVMIQWMRSGRSGGLWIFTFRISNTWKMNMESSFQVRSSPKKSTTGRP